MSENKTIANLMTAFAGESQANRKYLAYAKKAEEEGKMNAAKSSGRRRTPKPSMPKRIWWPENPLTAENLKDAMPETYEQEMYPPRKLKRQGIKPARPLPCEASRDFMRRCLKPDQTEEVFYYPARSVEILKPRPRDASFAGSRNEIYYINNLEERNFKRSLFNKD